MFSRNTINQIVQRRPTIGTVNTIWLSGMSHRITQKSNTNDEVDHQIAKHHITIHIGMDLVTKRNGTRVNVSDQGLCQIKKNICLGEKIYFLVRVILMFSIFFRRSDGRFSDTASVVSNAVINHYASYHRRPVNRVSWFFLEINKKSVHWTVLLLPWSYISFQFRITKWQFSFQNQSSNLLSATLCLVKELDYPSLEVVEHAVRCRIDELAAEWQKNNL